MASYRTIVRTAGFLAVACVLTGGVAGQTPPAEKPVPKIVGRR